MILDVGVRSCKEKFRIQKSEVRIQKEEGGHGLNIFSLNKAQKV